MSTLSPVRAQRPPRASLSPIPRPKSSLKMGGGMKSSTSTGSLRRNKISFGDTSTLLFEKEIDGEDEEHKNTVWYSKQEMKTIRKDLKKSIKKGDITRGLEQYEGDMGVESKERRLNHIYSILDLQNEQKEKGIADDKSLQMLSRAMSADDIGRARRLASMDSTEAFSEYSRTQSTIIRTTSKNALDNFRKQVQTSRTNQGGQRNAVFGNYNSGSSSSGSGSGLGLAALGLGKGGLGSGSSGKGNATFGAKKPKKVNPLLQMMAMKQKQKNNNNNNNSGDPKPPANAAGIA